MKKIIILGLIVITSMMMAACGGKEKSKEEDKEAAKQSEEEVPAVQETDLAGHSQCTEDYKKILEQADAGIGEFRDRRGLYTLYG